MRKLGSLALVAALASTLLLGSCIVACGCLPPPGTVRVEVKDADGKGVADVPVELRSGGTRRALLSTRADGTVDFTAQPDLDHVVEVLPPSGYTSDPVRANVRVDSRKTTTVRFTLVRPAGGG